ncbi:MAG: oligosaccharide flippase family protein, partial [Lachnospiraceae bacterium]|nr:oligosaccharide flippase family protein [Lachnospiraceae bacterium]
MSQSPSVGRNYIWNTVNQVFILLVPLIVTPYLSRVLGADGIGIYSYVNSIASYFIITAILGTTLYGQRSIACVRNNREDCSKAFWEIQIFRMLASTICLAFFFIMVSFVKENILIYFILSINIVNVIFDISWFYYGIEDFKKIAIRNFVVKICHMIFIFVFINDSSDLWLYAASVVGFAILGNASMWFSLPKILVKVSDVHPLKNIKDIILLFLPTMATQVYCVLDKSMIGWITGSSYQNGCYEQAEKVARFSLSIVTSIAMVVLPRVANLFENQKKEDVLFYIYKAYRFTTFLAFPIMFGLIGVAGTFVPVFFGEGYDLVEVLMPIFSILVVAVSLAYLTGYSYLISTKQQNVYTFSVAVAAVCN